MDALLQMQICFGDRLLKAELSKSPYFASSLNPK